MATVAAGPAEEDSGDIRLRAGSDAGIPQSPDSCCGRTCSESVQGDPPASAEEDGENVRSRPKRLSQV